MGSRLGYAGLGTRGTPLTTSKPHWPDLSGGREEARKSKEKGMQILSRSAKRKTIVKNPRV
jgi:hypothetical protein